MAKPTEGQQVSPKSKSLGLRPPDEWKVTLGSVWRKTRLEGVPMKMPSGNVALVRNVPADIFVKEDFPAGLTSLVADLIQSSEEKEMQESLRDKLEKEDPIQWFRNYVEMLDIVARLALVNPKVVAVATADDEITIADIDLDDKEALYALLGMPASQLESFCREQTENVEPLEAVEGDAPSPE